LTPRPHCGRKDFVNEKSGIEPATFRLVVQCLNQLRHRLPLFSLVGSGIDDTKSSGYSAAIAFARRVVYPRNDTDSDLRPMFSAINLESFMKRFPTIVIYFDIHLRRVLQLYQIVHSSWTHSCIINAFVAQHPHVSAVSAVCRIHL